MKEEADVMKMYQDQFNESFLLLKNLGDGKNRHGCVPQRSGKESGEVNGNPSRHVLVLQAGVLAGHP
jgi:hypothetical protein